jgi:tetratricopeptide (TPR) repeat protein
MPQNDWFRNTSWNAQIEADFLARLKRARDKGQYLRIQASYLSSIDPNVSLMLLEKYFALGDHFDFAAGHEARADAHLALGKVDAAFESYENALKREREYPKLKTLAYLDLPFTVAFLEARDWYDRALIVLDEYRDRLMFPVDYFRWHGAKALISADSSLSSEVTSHANEALNRTPLSFSGFPRHPKVGLVTDKYAEIIDRLRALTDV